MDDTVDSARIAEAHRIYDDFRRIISDCATAAFLDQARDPDEERFWVHVYNFFLQQKQRELIAEGVY